MVVAFVPGAARDESHGDLPIIQRERAVHRTVIELGEQVAKPINTPLELTEERLDIGVGVTGFRYRFIGVNHRYQRIVFGECAFDEPAMEGHRFAKMPKVFHRRPDVRRRTAPGQLCGQGANVVTDRSCQWG